MIKESKYVAVLLAISAAFASQAQPSDSDDEQSPLDQVVPVADEDPGTTSAQAEADNALTPEERLSAEFDRYRRLINEDAMDEADASAKRIVEMVIRLFGPQSLEASKALNNLALVQNKNGQFEAAMQNFESAVEIIEVLEDRLNEQLVNPLKGLGSAQLSSGRPDLAVKTFDRATHITHVNEGPHNIEQVEILEGLAESKLLFGDKDGARKVLDRIHVLNVRHFKNNELALVPSLMRRARWQHAARYYNDERATYRRAIRILEAKLGKNDPQLIVPLSKLAESFYYIDLSQSGPQPQGLVSTGELYFKRAAKIAEANPDIGWRELIDVKLALADYYVYVESQNRARRIYKEVWAFLSTDEERLAARAELLEQPVVLMAPVLPTHINKGALDDAAGGEFLTGKIRVDYRVSDRGRVRNIRTEAFPPEFTEMQQLVHREIRNSVFRPRLVESKIESSDNLIYEHSFFYRQADLDKLIKQIEQTTKKSGRRNRST